MSAPQDLIGLILALSLFSLVPFIAVMATSFVKISIILSLVRNALGVQQIPPNIAIHGLAIILSAYIMAPIGYRMVEALETHPLELKDPGTMKKNLGAVLEPYREFLATHTGESQREFFAEHSQRSWPEDLRKSAGEDSLFVLLPAFTVSELTKAFEVGFLLYLPFVVIDLIISNILLALGMMMVSPMTISLPFKLLLFVMLDGWTRLIEGLVMSY